jgi:hypothetical protein
MREREERSNARAVRVLLEKVNFSQSDDSSTEITSQYAIAPSNRSKPHPQNLISEKQPSAPDSMRFNVFSPCMTSSNMNEPVFFITYVHCCMAFYEEDSKYQDRE